MAASEFAIRRLRSPAELALAAEQLRHAGYETCAQCEAWHKAESLVPDTDCHMEICRACRFAEDMAPFSVED